ncbi:bacterial Ig-like domain-containing protein [Enterococcus faecalis]|uniref:bacterial Ig-like domain-containing protein n=1 Tax=Enterococcus faecalis TaxID=1351 RepID=UPI001025D6CD|nr:bacterial Ig-like domain-containing protein [Enterococcus faecalis]VFA80473.1 LPXTG-domain-containing protein cell wall anchor domain protein [Enterococcus faecalis]
MRKKFILLLFVLIFSIKQEEVVFSEIETVSTQAKIIESYDNTLRQAIRDMEIITPYYIDEGEVFDHRKVVLDATDVNGFKIPLFEIRYKWEDKALDTSKKGNSAVALLYWEKDPFTTYRATIKVAYDLILQTQNSTIYQGEIWNPVTNFVRANDEDSNPVYWNDDRIKTNNASIDTNVPGVYYHRYTLKGQNKEVSSTFKVTVKEDQTKAELKDTELHVGQKWDLGSIFKNVVDKDGNPIKPEEIKHVWIDGQETREIDTSKPDKHIVQIAVLKANNEWAYSNTITVTVKEDQTKAELKDTELHVGQKWDLGSIFKNVVDKDGNPIKPEEIKHVWIDGQETREIDTSKPDKHIVQIAVLKANNEWAYSNTVTVTVKEDQTKAELKDTELHVGQKWDLGSIFKNVVDKDGNPIKPEEIKHVWIDGQETREIDTSKPDKHIVQIAVLKANNEWAYSNTVTVTVKEDQTKAELKDTELHVGQKWDLGSIFKNVVDKDGNPIKPEEIKHVWIDGQETREIDTSKPDKHIVQIAVLKANNEWAYSNTITVTVKEPFTIKQVPYFDFEDHILVSTNKSVVNKKEHPTIELETPSIEGKDWQLQVELSPFLDKKNSKSILKGVSLFIPKGKLESDLETEEPTQYDCQLEANGKASILMHGTKTKGKGRWKNKLETKGITLSIPPENKTGNYESTLHWTLLDAPG